MGELPILFNAEMARAILEGRKSMTRRPVKPQPDPSCFTLREWCEGTWRPESRTGKTGIFKPDAHYSPFGQSGDRLWVRETWKPTQAYMVSENRPRYTYVRYRADGHRAVVDHAMGGSFSDPWRPSIHMPRWASRINLLVKRVWVERLQDISPADAMAEGLGPTDHGDLYWDAVDGVSVVDQFAELWNSIYSAEWCRWERNLWAWCCEFEVVRAEAPQD